MSLFPVKVLSIESWFRREFSRFPWDFVHLNEGLVVNQKALNPYRARVIILYTQEGRLSEVKGFLHYGAEELCETLPPILPQALPSSVKFGEIGSLLEIESYIMRYVNPTEEFPIPPQHFGYDCLILMLGRYGWHKVQNPIPLEVLQALGIRLPPEIEPRLEDLQAFFPRPYRHWYEVELAYVPNDLSKVIPLLWPGGKIHLTDADVWQVALYPPIRRPLSDGQLRLMDAFIKDAERAKRIKRFQTAGKSAGSYETAEDTRARLAPCMRSILERKRFPRDQERQYLVRIWAKARVPERVVEEILVEKNNQHPHSSGCIDLERRWDWQSHYRKRYAEPWCERMQLYCPFQGELDQRKSQCYLGFLEKFPKDKAPHPKSFKGPLQWYEW